MIMSFLFIALSAGIGIGMWFLVIGIVLSIGGGDIFTAPQYDSLFFYSAVLLLCIVSYLWFIKHLLDKNLQLLLFICMGTTMLFFFPSLFFELIKILRNKQTTAFLHSAKKRLFCC